MRRWIRALPVILVGVLAVMATTTATASAAVTGGLLQVTPVGGSSASGVTVAIDPGASIVRPFTLVNRSARLALTVRLAAVDATAGPKSTVHYESSAAAGSTASWLTLSDVVVTLQPRAKLRVSLTISPPANAAPGKEFAGVVAKLTGAARAADQTPVPATGSLTLPVAIQVKGAATALVSITGARVVAAGRDYLEVTFQNAGATPNTMSGRVEVRGSRPRAQPIRTSVAALTHTTVRVPFAMPSGAKTVPISVTATDPGGDQATWSGTVGLAAKPAPPAAAHARSTRHRSAATIASSARSLPLGALILVVVAFVAAVLWLGVELRKSRAARRATKLAPARPVAPLPADAPGIPVAPAPAAPVVPAPVAPLAPLVPAVLAGADDPMGAVAAQLGALVGAIDRLVARLDDGPTPEIAPARGRAPSPSSSAADLGALLYAPAARVPEPSPDDLYDWPTEAQLEQFEARRRAAQHDIP
jgi:hypothetical protein